MSRTKRQIQNWVNKSCDCDHLRMITNLRHRTFLHNSRKDGRCEFCCRDRWMNGYDNKPSSPLYADFIKGCDRDFHNGAPGRRYHKKSARRHRRREEKKLIMKEKYDESYS